MLKHKELIDFYLGAIENPSYDNFYDYRWYTLDQMEKRHDWIQWAFPSPIKSVYNPTAPILTDKLIKVLNNHRIIFSEHETLLERFADVYAFHDVSWLHPYDHNILRISRILNFTAATNHKFPLLHDFKKQQNRLLEGGHINQQTFNIWKGLIEQQ